jgi:hypothetical protein
MVVLRKSVLAAVVGVVSLGFLGLRLLHQPESVVFPVHAHPRPAPDGSGDFGGDLGLLRRYYVAPKNPHESNHYMDLWSGNTLPILARLNHLTNNHALFVDSHGKAGCGRASGGYGFYPHHALLQRGQTTPYFSPGDLAQVIGAKEAANIHNVVLAGCNVEGRFRSSEVRRHFPNATNITYMTPGELAFKPMYYQAIVLPASEIRCLFGKAHPTNDGRVESRICTSPAPHTQALGVYVADLYLPSAKKPYRTVRASRELLDPSYVNTPAAGNVRTRPAADDSAAWRALLEAAQAEVAQLNGEGRARNEDNQAEDANDEDPAGE